MKLKTISKAIAGLALAAGVAGSAQAFNIVAGDYKILLDNYDSGSVYGPFIGPGGAPLTICGTLSGTAADIAACDVAAAFVGGTAPGSVGSVNASADTMGILSVSSITKISNGATLFSRGTGAGQDGFLTGVFGNLSDFFVQNTLDITTGSVNSTALGSGGTFALYYSALNDYDPTCGGSLSAPTACGDLNALAYAPSITPPGNTGSLYLSGVFKAGAVSAVAPTASYRSTFEPTSLTGNGIGYLDFTGGSALSIFDNGTTVTSVGGVLADAKLLVQYRATLPDGTPVGNGWTVFSSGDITGTALPEPGSMALVGLGLMGLAGLRRRKQQA